MAISKTTLKDAVLMLDERCEGIAPNVVQEMGDSIIRLNRDYGLTLLLVEQKLKFARRVADRFSILERGRNVAQGQITELNAATVARYLTV